MRADVKKITDELWTSGLPLARQLREHRPASVMDLTRRPRPDLERACQRLEIAYNKQPVDYDGTGNIDAANLFETLPKPCLVHCFHGRDRTPLVARWIMRRRLDVYLYRVGRNLNRAYRACAAFGVRRLLLCDCPGKIDGGLFSAAGSVEVVRADELPREAVAVLDQRGILRARDVDWLAIRALVVGGETDGIPGSIAGVRVRIEQDHRLELTVAAALSIALYQIGA